MGKKFKEKYLEMKIGGDEYVKIDGSVLPYIVNRFGTVYGHGPGGIVHVQPTQEASTGFLKVTLFDGPIRYEEYLHVIVAQAYIPNPESLTDVRHMDKNPMNCSTSNLEWYDPDPEPETNPSKDNKKNTSTLSDEVICVCYRAFQGKTPGDIAKEFNLDISKVKEIRRNHEAEFVLAYDPGNTKVSACRAKLKFLRPFIKSLIRKRISDQGVAEQVNMPDIDFVTVQRHVRHVREKKMEPEFYAKKK